ncbi:MAG: MBL fold metallo-hydrolase, partial [Chitinophagaceae bacterium]
AYYIESEGEAAVIDPLRDIEPYLQLAKERNASIKYIFETHFHADFVSGHIDLANTTGATIVYGPETKTNYPVHVAKDGELFTLGKLQIAVLHTPGHTLESSCFLLKDAFGKDYALFTGDTLFIGDVGRPDLAQKSTNLTMQELAGMLFESLNNKIMPLADDIIIYPAHGAGSSCGKKMAKETSSSLGEQKKTNYALQAQTKEAFIAAVTEGLAEPPVYFPINAAINKQGYTAIDTLLQQALQPLTVSEFKKAMHNENTIILDTRPADIFTQSFIPGSIFIGLEGRFAEWAGMLLPFDKNILIVCEEGKEKETATRLSRVGFEKMQGYLKGSLQAWIAAGESIDMIIDIEADELAMDLPFDENLVVIDVRKEIEYAEGHITDAVNIPLETMNDPGSISNVEETDNLYVHCAGGYRSVIAASILKQQGFHNLRNILGGWNAIKEQGNKIPTQKTEALLN